ncbi:MAG: 4-hydroxy-tetrahydrodipicolinate synthase, partial [Actinomycetota bacterium]|nr:4-hydroxy-tetrahydrodipicolinate synthase [Actinomycetota bacterium]
AVKDAKGDLQATSQVLAETDLAYYSGDDAMTLPLLSIGAVGVVGVATHLTGDRMAALVSAYSSGDVTTAATIHRSLQAAFVGFFRTQGVIMTKAALDLAGLPGGGSVRPPLVDATAEQRDQLRKDLTAAGLLS